MGRGLPRLKMSKGYVQPLRRDENPGADPLEECLCGHLREDHAHNGTPGDCKRNASSGYRCSCPSFEPVSQ